MRRLALLSPLRHRDFALLWTGMTISLLGDGIYLVAIAWQVYDLTGSPTALSLVGLAWSLGMVALLLLGGSVADRVDRRVQMVGADALRLTAVATMGVLAVTGLVEVWHLVALSLVFGVGEAFFSPAFSALIPQVVPRDDLMQANALQQVVRPAAFRLAGPALGGLLVAAFGAGTAFLVDAGTFAVAIGCVLAIRARPAMLEGAVGAAHGGVREGLAWARQQPWFWASLAMTTLGIMLTLGPLEVLLPYVVRKDVGAPASAFGLILAAGGVGGIVGGLHMSRLGMPARPLRFMYLWWALAAVTIAGYAAATAVWQLAALTFLYGVGIVVRDRRVGDPDADPDPERDARPRLRTGLDGVDRPVPRLLRADRSDRRGGRRRRDAARRRPARRGAHARDLPARPAAARGRRALGGASGARRRPRGSAGS